MSVKSTVERLFSIRTASAHCDIPCGIYDPISAKIAAQTVQKMQFLNKLHAEAEALEAELEESY